MTRTSADLARILEIPLHELERISKEARSAHYRYERRLIGKKIRLLRVPRPPLRRILDAIKERVLDSMPLPPTMHGWRKKRSCKSYVKPHVRRSTIVNVDIQDFFPNVNGGRVFAFWVRAGFVPEAAKLLTALTICDNQLPQGSPTSQAIGNQVLIRLDRRLNRLAAVNGSRFSMYGDEFTISGRKRVKRLKGLTIRIVEQEGFKVNPTKIKEPDRSKSQEIAGIIVNRKPSLGRDHYKELRAIIHNCLKNGPASQNRNGVASLKDHLRGRVSHLQQINKRLGDQLLLQFERIAWD